jgi:hypothetical protein
MSYVLVGASSLAAVEHGIVSFFNLLPKGFKIFILIYLSLNT